MLEQPWRSAQSSDLKEGRETDTVRENDLPVIIVEHEFSLLFVFICRHGQVQESSGVAAFMFSETRALFTGNIKNSDCNIRG